MTPQVTFFHRKKRPCANFSIERIFHDVRWRLANRIEARHHIAPYFSNGLLRRIAIALDARRHQGQVNHVTGDINFAVLFLNSRTTILTSHDCSFLHRTSGLRRRVLKYFWVDLPVSRARLITTVSEEAKRDLLRHTQCDPEKIVVIYNPISEAFTYRPKDFHRERPRILQVGTAPNKNVPRLIQALEGVPCTLAILGTLNEDIRRLLHRCNIEYDNYTDLSDERVVQQYEQADIVAFASTVEGFGLPILEAQAVGRPVVTSNTSSMPEIAGGGACLVDPLDVGSIRAGILRVISEDSYRKDIVRRGLKNVRRFHPDEIAAQYLRLYQQVAHEADVSVERRAADVT